MVANRLVLISNHANDASFMAAVASSRRDELLVFPDAKAAMDTLAQLDVSAIFVDVTQLASLREFEFEVQQRFGLFSDRVRPNSIHFVSEHDLSKSRDAILSPLFGSFFQRPQQDIEAAGSVYGRFVVASEQQSTHELRQFLSVERLGPQAIQSVEITHTDQKQEAVEAVRQYLLAAKLPARVSNIIANAVDELLMNALFDAPTDEFGRHIYNTTQRNLSRELLPRERVTMKLGFDGLYFGISVVDQFGSLDRNKLLGHVSDSYRERDYSVRSGQAGAGLGVATIFNTGGTLIYHCESGQRTEVTLLYRGYGAYRDFKEQFRFFSAKFF